LQPSPSQSAARMAPSCSRPASSASSLSSAGASSLNLAALAIDDEVDAASTSLQPPVAIRAPSTPSFRYSPTPISQSHRASGISMKRDHFHTLEEECRGSAGKQYHSSLRESKLHRREGWGSVDSRRAYSDLSALCRQGKERHSLNSSYSSLSSTTALDNTRYSFDANDWGYFVDTP
jgi:hypothetical protein